MATVSSKADEIVHEILEEKKEVDDIEMDGVENTATYSAIVSEEKPVSEDVSEVEGQLENSGKIKESEALEKIDVDSSSPIISDVNVKNLQDENGIPEEQKRESSDVIVPDVSETIENEDLNAPTSTEVSVNDLEVQSEVKTEVDQNFTDLNAAEVSSDQERGPETAEFVEEEKETRFNIDKKGIEATVKDLSIIPGAIEVLSKDKEVSTSDERKSESLKDVDETSVKSPKDYTIFEELPEQVSEKNKNESSNDFETPESAAEALKGIGSSEMVEDRRNDSKDHCLVEQIVQIPDNEKEQTHIEEAVQIATDESEQKELGAGAEKEKSRKSNDVEPIVSSDATDTKLIKESTKRESNNLFSKAKHLLVKAKKAILGKSSGPKTGS